MVAQQDSPSERMLSVRLGAQAPLVDSCSGHLILAFADKLERAAMVAKIPRHHRRLARGELEAMAARVREQGFEVIPSAHNQSITDIGYPVFDHTGSNIAELVVPFFSFSGSSHSVDVAAAQAMVRDAAGAISRSLGSVPAPGFGAGATQG